MASSELMYVGYQRGDIKEFRVYCYILFVSIKNDFQSLLVTRMEGVWKIELRDGQGWNQSCRYLYTQTTASAVRLF